MTIFNFLLAVIFILLCATTLFIAAANIYKSKKTVLAQKRALDQRMNSCKKVLTHEIDFVKQVYDIVILGKNNPEFLHKKITKLLLERSGYESILIKDSIEIVNICSCNLIAHFSKEFPELSKNDLEFCSLICLGFPSHTMQTFYELDNTTSYYNRRKRLRTKLKIDSSANLETFIKEKIKILESEDIYL